MSLDQEMESLKLAIKTEEDGRKMYLQAAQRVSNPLAKAVFTQLAKEETVHIEVITQFYQGLKAKGKGEVSAEIKRAMNYDLRKKTIFESAKNRMDDTVSAGPDVFSAYKIAMKFEEDGAKMYEESAKKTADANAKMIYQFMNIQENEHYRLLAESLNYLENPQQWFLEAEKPHFEG
jgi:rubrerythrin